MVLEICLIALGVWMISIEMSLSSLAPHGPSGYVSLVLSIMNIVLGLSLWIRHLYLIGQLKRTGWRIPLRYHLFDLSILRIHTIRHIVSKEEFRVTPEYGSNLGDVENLRRCIRAVKDAKKRSRELFK